jgi:hypothetical protein
VLLYEGPSLLTSTPIVCIATGLNGKSKNAKTGAMVQTYILDARTHPLEAIKTGADESVCGDCPARGTWCYASRGPAGQGLGSIYRKYRDGGYPKFDLAAFEGCTLRLGAYGDPAAVPVSIWHMVANVSSGFTGYTHQWRNCDPTLRLYCMASVDSEAEAVEAAAAGWRYYRVTSSLGDLMDGEVFCPHYATGIQCDECLYCDGTSRSSRGSVVALVHGSGARKFEQHDLALA